MSSLSKLFKGAAAAKVVQIARREAAKPENQRKARELLSRVTNRGGGRPGTTPRP